ncbi:pyridoxal phosphate-dependent aminotransferase [Streptomyces sp. PTM05]|uniref:Aminotransferase n=1 Tax=Streptantibioticus parmotrematis TaxID=2873249 RepID=A0ABS7QYY9_9ACTN|nr:pyridoxal phosphate-dependent aminotransferase [Streptantibioticus parmotrematis]MBY8886997.1 pyridoxal phosphate-dependent aminotransferase [Streptantibioticus parmotrematis]
MSGKLIEPFSVPARAVPTRLVTSDGTPVEDRCLLDGCENDSISLMALDAVRSAQSAHLLLHWDSQDVGLRQDLSDLYDVDSRSIFLCSGGMDAIRTAFDVFGPIARNVGLCKPDWPGFHYFASRTRKPIKFLDRTDYPYIISAEDVAGFCVSTEVELIILSNPSAVTGRVWHPDEVRAMLLAAPETMFVIDEADSIYPESSSMSLVREVENVVFLGSLSKFLGLSGLRVGFIVVPDRAREAFRNTIDPIGLASVAIMASRAALSDTAYQRTTQRETAENRGRLVDAVAGTPYRVVPGSECFACYLSADETVPDPYESLQNMGIELVPGSLFGLPRGGRLNLRNKRRIDRLVTALRGLADPTDRWSSEARTRTG